MAAYGDVLEELDVGDVRVVVRYGCTRRDQYDLRCPLPLPPALREALGARGPLRGNDALYVIDVPGIHQITVAPERGRVVIMPRMTLERPAQRAAAMEVAGVIDQIVTPR
jgi:hypothetical protein